MNVRHFIRQVEDPWTNDPRTLSLQTRVAELEQELAAFTPEMDNILVCPWGVSFTRTEMAFIWVLAASAGRVVPRTVAYSAVYPDDDGPEPKILDVYLAKSRRKLTPLGLSVRTLWGQGWVMSKEDGALWMQWCDAVRRGDGPPADYPIKLRYVGGPSREHIGRYLHFRSGWVAE